MSLGKIMAITAAILVTLIAVATYFKESPKAINSQVFPALDQTIPLQVHRNISGPIEVSLEPEIRIAPPEPMKPSLEKKNDDLEPKAIKSESSKSTLPDVDRIAELFSTTGKKLPFIETVTYKSRVSWQKGRPAWLSDYASHYGTSRHFIARSLNGTRDYLKQEVAEGNKFNVFKENFPLEFHLIIDASRCKMWLYALSGEQKEKILLKTYTVSLGRPDDSKESGILTPLGKFKLGSRIAIYKPKVIGHYKGQKTEMIQVFGTRWIPFEAAIGETTLPAKGFGLHGVPWVKNTRGELEEDTSSLGKFESDGCVRMATEDMEEVYAIVITKPAYVELVKDYTQSELVLK